MRGLAWAGGLAVSLCAAGCGLTLDYGAPDRDGGGVLDASEHDAGLDASENDGAIDGAIGDAAIDGAMGDAEVRDGDVGDVTLCNGDGDCLVADPCQLGVCDLTSHMCSVMPDPCTPPDECHLGTGCDPSSGCAFELVDGDMDGHAPLALGSCGDDCNDDDASVFPGQTEICDGHDQDCDGLVDEGSGTACGRDLDGDHYGSGTDVVWSCTGLCPTGTVASTNDCWDEAAAYANLAHPGQRTYFTMMTGAGGFDWNCDGVEEPINNRVFVSCTGMGTACDGQSGWLGALPTCGTAAVYQACLTDALLNCVLGPVGVSTTAACR